MATTHLISCAIFFFFNWSENIGILRKTMLRCEPPDRKKYYVRPFQINFYVRSSFYYISFFVNLMESNNDASQWGRVAFERSLLNIRNCWRRSSCGGFNVRYVMHMILARLRRHTCMFLGRIYAVCTWSPLKRIYLVKQAPQQQPNLNELWNRKQLVGIVLTCRKNICINVCMCNKHKKKHNINVRERGNLLFAVHSLGRFHSLH